MAQIEASMEEIQAKISNLATTGDQNDDSSNSRIYLDSILDTLRQIFEAAILKAYPSITNPPISVTPSSIKGVDYQCNSAMPMLKRLRDNPLKDDFKTNPKEIAENIKENVADNPIIEKITIANPGFINIVINNSYVCTKVNDLVKYGIQFRKPEKPIKVLVDYSSPNIAKEMHVGHLRSTIIGDCIANIYEFIGHEVIRVNHVGDWGTQFGMLLAHLEEKFPNFLDEPLAIADLQTFYKESKARFDSDEEFKKRAYSCVVKLQAKEPKMITGWQQICDISRKEFQKIYERLGISKLEEKGESFYHDMMLEIVKDLESRQLLEDSEGKRVIYDDCFNGHLLIVKSDGGFTYDTSDLACVRYRVETEKAEKIIYVTDKGQSDHFRCLFQVASKVNYVDPVKVKLVHVGFGVVVGEDNKKFKTRSGDTVRLFDLLEEGLQRASAKLVEKDRAAVLSEEELNNAKEAIAYGCIKYADLSKDLTLDYQFSFDRMLDDRGNTAVYLLYSLTRIRSIINNAKMTTSMQELAKSKTLLKLDHPREIRLAKFVLKFPEIINAIAQDLRPHNLCTYLFELSVTFSEFYEQCYVIEKKPNSDETTVNINRLILCEATAQVIATSLKILGIKTVSKM